MTQNAMTEMQEETLTFDVSDEALEIAASGSSWQMNFTLAACTGLSACPA
jgi:NADH:ubiquinone oxidoreductase subunit B-like Fe-S oxidoreductase